MVATITPMAPVNDLDGSNTGMTDQKGDGDHKIG
jgi:hypothetical protein